MPTLESLSRRTFVKTGIVTGLATGFALAVQPIAKATITTDDKGLVAGEVKVTGPDGFVFPAYQAYPDKANETFPMVVVIQEIFGVHEHIKDMCRRFAKHGYFAIAPELYARQGDVSNMSSIQDIIQKVVSKVPDAQVAGDIDATIAYANGTGKVAPNRLGVTGFCWGGRQTWLYAAHNPHVRAAAAWYGPLVGNPSDLQPKSVLDIADDITVPVLGLYGGQDTNISTASIDEMRQKLAAGKSGSEIVVFADAGHGFNADYRPSYNEEDAKAAFARLLDWFGSHGAA